MPKPIVEAADLVARCENGSLSRLRSQAPQRFGTATRQERDRMDDALACPIQYLSRCGDPEIPLFVNLGGMAKTMGTKINALCREIGVSTALLYKTRKVGLQIIVDGLTAAGKAPL